VIGNFLPIALHYLRIYMPQILKQTACDFFHASSFFVEIDPH